MPGGPEWQERQHIAKGGSSDVYKVKLSPSQQSHLSRPNYFALKKLKPGHEDTFKREVESLAHFAPMNHPHIVKLLMAYKQTDTYNLLFPWAEGNLSTFWHSSVMEPSPESAYWMLKQCIGIADGLAQIHSDKRETNMYGRHGDIKPANILWFRSDSDAGTEDKLVLSDFGLSQFHSTDAALRESRKKIGGTMAYAPPEVNDPESCCSRSYDIWSLGCVYLEFVIWLLWGWKGVRKFRRQRSVMRFCLRSNLLLILLC